METTVDKRDQKPNTNAKNAAPAKPEALKDLPAKNIKAADVKGGGPMAVKKTMSTQ
jgi:hypothetical protein